MKRVLITGASGQVGVRLIKYLPNSEFDIYSISSNPSKVDCEFSNKRFFVNLLEDDLDSIFQNIRPDLLIHLAWDTTPNTFWNSSNNEKWLQASKKLVKSFQRHGGTKIVISGTCAEYDWRGLAAHKETDLELPQSIYGQTKLELLNFLRQSSLTFLWTRTFFQFGDQEPRGRLVSSAIDAIRSGNEYHILKPDDIRDYIYINDVAEILSLLIIKGADGIYNIGSGVGVSMRELGTNIALALGHVELMKYQEQCEKPSIVVADITKLEKAIGDFRCTSLEDALRRTINERSTG